MPLAILGLAARALQAHRFRALLTVLSVAIGAFAIVLMSSLAQSGFATLKRSIEQVGGARMLLIVPKTPEREEVKGRAYRLGLTERDADALFASLPHAEQHTRYANFRSRPTTGARGASSRADLVAADAQFMPALRFRVARGRELTASDQEQRARVCVIGHAVAEALYAGDALGRWLTIDGSRCRVVGVLAPSDRFGFNIGFDWEKLVLIPATTGADWFAEMPRSSLLLVVTDDVEANDTVMRILNARLVERHHGIDDFSLINFSALLRKFYAAFVIMEVIAGCLAGVALVIGGIGIMNMMLVSVSERTREIGIQKALGARPAELGAQFLAEAALLSLAGGLAGTALGVGLASAASFGVRRLMASWMGMTSWVAVGVSLVSALGIGVGFGWLPARRAAQLSPVEAMRR